MMAHDLSRIQFTAKDIYKILGVDKNQLFHWINTHRLLEPDIEEGGGRGKRRIFSRKNLLELAIITQMHNYGIELRWIREIKKLLDSQSIRAKCEDGKWLPVWEKYVRNTRKFNLYDWAFAAEIETRIRFYFDPDRKRINFYTLIGQEQEKWDKGEVRKLSSYLTINVTKIANSIPDVAMKK